jgi:hypothetical protein
VSPATPTPGFLTRYDFYLSTAALSINDPRFAADGHLGADVDLMDYGKGRMTFVADYEVVLGSQLRTFDPNQSIYTLESFFTYRARRTEIAGGFHHVSRHLSDRSKLFGIAWNELGVRVMRPFAMGASTLHAQLDAGRLVQHSFVDYTWMTSLDLRLDHPMTARTSVFAHGSAELIGVNPAKAGRTTPQNGGAVDLGVRLTGRAAAVELFGGYERRIDADPIDRLTLQWLMAGFRLTGK